jgi:TPR repeat protein
MPHRIALILACLAMTIMSARAETAQSLFERGMQYGKAGDFAAALPLIRSAADAGHADAQFTLGTMYANGQGVPLSKTDAIAWFERAGARNHPRALYNLGLYHDRGIGVAKDMVRALAWYRRGAAAGDAQAAYNAGHIALTGDGVPRDAAEGLRLLQQSASAGTAEAQASLGYIHETGYGTRKDAAQALDYYAQAERNNLGGAGERRLTLASAILEEGIALENDRHGPEALRLQDLACTYGQHYACYNAARLRHKGEIVPRDVRGALKGFQSACDRGMEAACHYAADAVLSGASTAPADIGRTDAFVQKLCNQGNAKACHNLAVIRMNPAFGTPDPDVAMKMLAQNCINRNFNQSCQPYYNMYNATLPQSSGSSSSGSMSLVEEGILGILSMAVDGLSALSAAGRYSQGSYAGYSSYAPPATTISSGYSPADRANFSNFMDSIRHPTVTCRVGNPYC